MIHLPEQFNPKKAPVVLWLQGGPGGTSMFGLFLEHGPFGVTGSMKLVERKTAWSLTHNMLYVDNPVGTGSKILSYLLRILIVKVRSIFSTVHGVKLY